MVRSSLVEQSKWNGEDTIPVLCVHGDLLEYPTAEVRLEMDGREKKTKVALIPDVPVEVIIGTDDFDLEKQPKPPNLSMAVTTRSQSRKMTEKQANNQHVASATTLAEGEGNVNLNDSSCESKTNGILVEEKNADCSCEVDCESEGGNEDSNSQNILSFSPAQLQALQKKDPTLEKAQCLAAAKELQAEDEGPAVFCYRDGLLYQRCRPKGSRWSDTRSCEQLVLPQQCRSEVLKIAQNKEQGLEEILLAWCVPRCGKLLQNM